MWEITISFLQKVYFLCNMTAVVAFAYCRMRDALNYLAHAYETNSTLLRNGEKRGVDKSLIAVYRRKCLTVSRTIFHSVQLQIDRWARFFSIKSEISIKKKYLKIRGFGLLKIRCLQIIRIHPLGVIHVPLTFSKIYFSVPKMWIEGLTGQEGHI